MKRQTYKKQGTVDIMLTGDNENRCLEPAWQSMVCEKTCIGKLKALKVVGENDSLNKNQCRMEGLPRRRAYLSGSRC